MKPERNDFLVVFDYMNLKLSEKYHADCQLIELDDSKGRTFMSGMQHIREYLPFGRGYPIVTFLADWRYREIREDEAEPFIDLAIKLADESTYLYSSN